MWKQNIQAEMIMLSRSTLPLFCSRVVFLCVFIPAFSVLFTGPSPLGMKFYGNFSPSLCCFLRGWNPETEQMNKMITIMWLPKLPDSSVQSVTEALLPSKFTLINNKNFAYFQHDVPCLTLPHSLDLDTVCVSHEILNIKALICYLCLVFELFCLYVLQ